MSSPPVSVGNPTSFSQVVTAFQNVGNDKHVRFQDSKGVYESNKGSLTAIKAFFGNKEAIAQREQKRSDGAAKLVGLIAHEYGPDIANRALMHMRVEGHDLSKGMTVGQMKSLDFMIKTSLNNQAMVQQGYAAQGALFRPDLQAEYNEKFDRPKHHETLANNLAATLNIDTAKLDMVALKASFANLDQANNLNDHAMTLAVIENFATKSGQTQNVDDIVLASKLLVTAHAKKAADAKIAEPTSDPIGNFMRGQEGVTAETAARPHFQGGVDTLVQRALNGATFDFRVDLNNSANKILPSSKPEEIAQLHETARKTAEFIDVALSNLFGGTDAASGASAADLISDEGARIFAAAVDAAKAQGMAVNNAFADEISANTTANAFALRHLNPTLVNMAKTAPPNEQSALIGLSKAVQFLANNAVVGNTKMDAQVQTVLAKYIPVIDAFNQALLARGQGLNA